jgi:hypothetical protein
LTPPYIDGTGRSLRNQIHHQDENPFNRLVERNILHIGRVPSGNPPNTCTCQRTRSSFHSIINGSRNELKPSGLASLANRDMATRRLPLFAKEKP